MLELITDRTQYHVVLLNRLRKKSWNNMTASERTAWYGEAAKGAYNYTDLNRVESAVAEIADKLGLYAVTKTDWTLWDIPTSEQMERYLKNVKDIREIYAKRISLPTLPNTMDELNYVSANNIEKVLFLVSQYIDENTSDRHVCALGKFVLGDCVLGGSTLNKLVLGECVLGGNDSDQIADTIRSGDIYCGEVV